MKKIVLLFVAVLVCGYCWGQLVVTGDSGNTKDNEIASIYNKCKIVLQDSVYLLKSNDKVNSAEYIVITLGHTKEQATESLRQLVEWVSAAKIKDYLSIVDHGDTITLYKSGSLDIICTYGNVDYIETYKQAYNSKKYGAESLFKMEKTTLKSDNNPALGYIYIPMLKDVYKKLRK